LFSGKLKKPANRSVTRDVILQVRDLSKAFPGVQALDRVQLDIEAGSVHALMGENGAGKSTLMSILAGLLTPDAGVITLHGRRVEFKNPHHARQLGIAMIHQELLPFPDLTVAENIGMGREPTRWFPGWVDKSALNREAAQLLNRLGVAIQPTRSMHTLSVAGMQTVEIAKALAGNASVIIMDEPTSAISGREVEALFAIIRDLKQRGVAVIYISHKFEEVFRIADTVTVLRDGRHVATEAIGDLDEPRLISLMVGRELTPPLAGRTGPGESALEVRGLTRTGKFQDVTFTLHRSEVLGIAGLMGAGRTDLACAICGLAPATSGELQVKGRPLRITRPTDALLAGIALVSEDRRQFGLVPQMSVAHNITLASLGDWFINGRAEVQVAQQQIRALAIKAPDLTQPVKHLSGGNQQKVVIAKALLTDPDILILDEPTRGIDIGAKAEVYAIINRLARAGKAVLLISSELPELLSLSDRIVVMREGRLTAELNPRQTSQEEILKFAMPT
jgi:inositol transport system ATP-binding protein